jgi:hypothetical protein
MTLVSLLQGMGYINVYVQEHSGGSINEPVKERGMGLERAELVDGYYWAVIGRAGVYCRQRIVICCLPHFGLCLHGLLSIKSVE